MFNIYLMSSPGKLLCPKFYALICHQVELQPLTMLCKNAEWYYQAKEISLRDAQGWTTTPPHPKEPVEVGASWVRYSGPVLPGGGPQHTGEITSLVPVFPQISWRRWLGTGRFGLLCLMEMLSSHHFVIALYLNFYWNDCYELQNNLLFFNC